VRRIGVFMPTSANDPQSMSDLTAFVQGLQQLGWSSGENVRIDFRWGAADAGRYPEIAKELVASGAEVIVALGTLAVSALQHTSRSVPIVFLLVVDPVGGGLVESLARPGGNTTGFAAPEFGTSGKHLELLIEIVPALARVAVTRDPANISNTAQFAAIQTVASPRGIELRPFEVRDSGAMERTLATVARQPNGGMIVTASGQTTLQRSQIIKLAAQYRLPAIYPFRFFVDDGGLASYGVDRTDQYRRVAGYVDRILRGEKPADLPVQAPTKYELVINIKTAEALGIAVPRAVLARAEEVIE
jgi:putative ABC transport system substrate-binding protein